MRHLQAWLVGAGLLLAPIRTAAERSDCPCPDEDDSAESTSPTSNRRLGVLVMNMTPELRRHLGAEEDSGVLVARVEPGSPAALAGIEVGDVIVDVHGRAIDSASDVVFALAEATRGDVPIRVIRDGQAVELGATVPDQPPAQEPQADWPAIDWLRQLGPITPSTSGL